MRGIYLSETRTGASNIAPGRVTVYCSACHTTNVVIDGPSAASELAAVRTAHQHRGLQPR